MPVCRVVSARDLSGSHGSGGGGPPPMPDSRCLNLSLVAAQAVRGLGPSRIWRAQTMPIRTKFIALNANAIRNAGE